MLSALLKRRQMWWPTSLGWLLLLALIAVPATLWWAKGESFLTITERVPADILVVEGWIGPDGVRAAAEEFRRGGYHYVVATGGLSPERGHRQRWSYTAEAAQELAELGVATAAIIPAEPRDVKTNRTFESAAAVRQTLAARGIVPRGLNVVSMGPHARRSRLVYQKASPAGLAIGVIAWIPDDYADEPWWHSSERADDLLKESVAYVLERVANSGRRAAPALAHASE